MASALRVDLAGNGDVLTVSDGIARGRTLRTLVPRVPLAVFAVLVVTAASGAGTAFGTQAVSGDASPRLDPVPVGKVAVVASSAPSDDMVAVIVQNGTDHAVTSVRVRGAVASADGGAAIASRPVAVVPGTLVPGDHGLAAIRFRKGSLALGTSPTFRVTWSRTKSASDPRTLVAGPLTRSVPMEGAVAQTLSFPVTNPGTRAVAGPITATVMCFNEAGAPVVATTTTVRRAGLGAGKSANVTASLAQLCPAAWVAVRSA
jgi:hypothetical protein